MQMASPLGGLHCAARTGDLAKLTELIRAGADLRAASPAGRTALHVAAEGGNAEAVRLLLDAGARADATMAGGALPIHCAARGRLPVGLDDPDPDIREAFAPPTPGASAVSRALFTIFQHRSAKLAGLDPDAPPSSETMRTLLELYCDAIKDREGCARLHAELSALGCDRSELDQMLGGRLKPGRDYVGAVRLLLDAGTPVDARDDSDASPLQSAVEGGHVDIARLLIERGASPDADRLIHAAMQGSREMVALLLDCGLPLGDALHRAAGNGNLEVVRGLLDRGTSADLRDAEGNTPLIVAAAAHHAEIARFLLDRGADPNARNASGEGPVDGTHAGLAEELMARGARAGPLALHHAARDFDMTMAERLLAAGADVNARDSDGNTPLHCVFDAYEMMPEAHDVIRFLVAHGAHADLANGKGVTPRQRAEREGCPECVAAMKS